MPPYVVYREKFRKSLANAIELILNDRREDALRGVPEDALKEIVINEAKRTIEAFEKIWMLS